MRTIKQDCAVCTRPGKPCEGFEGCHDIHYCSQACQKADWAVHRTMCSTLKDFGDSQRPTPDSKRAITFSITDKRPKFIWLEYGGHNPEERGYGPVFRKIMGEDSPHIDYSIIDRNPILGTELDHDIMLYCRVGFSSGDGYQRNQSIRHITDGASTIWAGPVIVYGTMKDGAESDDGFDDDAEFDDVVSYIDLDTTDLKTMSDWFTTQFDERQKTVCIVTNPRDERRPFFSIDIQRLNSLDAATESSSEIARLIGMPLIFVALPPEPGKEAELAGPIAVLLRTKCKFRRRGDWKTWGIPLESKKSGTIYVFRADGKPLSSQLFKALYDWCEQKLQPVFLEAQRACEIQIQKTVENDSDMEEAPEEVVEIRKKMLEEVTRQKFEDFHHGYVAGLNDP